jgi:hypothetical protein
MATWPDPAAVTMASTTRVFGLWGGDARHATLMVPA